MTRARASAAYLAIGGLSALLNNVVMIAGDAIGIHYAPLNLFAFLSVNSLAYALHARATFRAPMRARGYVRFMAGGANGLLLSTALFFIACTLLHMPMLIASPLVTGLMLLYNVMIARWAFARPRA